MEMLVEILVKGVSGESPAPPPMFSGAETPCLLCEQESPGEHTFLFILFGKQFRSRPPDVQGEGTLEPQHWDHCTVIKDTRLGPLHLSGGPQGMTETPLGLLKPSCLLPWEAPGPRILKICDT